MRKIYTCLPLLLIIVCTASQAQIKKGSLFLGGDLSLSTVNTKNANDEIKQNSFNISPVAGIAVKENFIAGASLKAGFSGYKSPYQATQKGNSFGAGVFARHYKNIGKSGFYVFVQNSLGAEYGEQRYEKTGSNDLRKVKTFAANLNIYPGVSYAVSRKLHLETGFNNLFYVNYSNEKNEFWNVAANSTRTNRFYAGTSLNNLSSFYVGFRVLIGK